MEKLTPVRLAWVVVAVMAAACVAFLLGVRAIGGVLMIVGLVALWIWWSMWVRSWR